MATSSSFGNMFSMAVASVVIPFLPMLPTQLLVANFLYDGAQIALPSDRVDDEYLRKPHHWDVGALRGFMIRVGLVSSVFDGVTFFVLLRWFHGDAAMFRSGWFVESMATQILVLFVIRTTGNPLHSRPGALLVVTIMAALCIAVALPYSPFAHALGFVPPPGRVLGFVVLVTAVYLFVVEHVKRRTMKRLLA